MRELRKTDLVDKDTSLSFDSTVKDDPNSLKEVEKRLTLDSKLNLNRAKGVILNILAVTVLLSSAIVKMNI